MIIRIVYFSATGTTELIAGEISRHLSDRNGYDVRVVQLEEAAESPTRLLAGIDALGIGYPVYDYRPPEPVMDFIRNLPPSEPHQSAFLFSTYGISALDSHVYAARALADRGYRCITREKFKTPPAVMKLYARAHRWPLRRLYRFGRNTPDRVHRFADRTADALANRRDDTEGNRRSIGIPAPFPGFWPAMSRAIFGQAFYRDLSVGEDCSGCGICVDSCPGGNLVLEQGRAHPQLTNGCLRCLRCVVHCPADTVNFTRRPRVDRVDPNQWTRMAGFTEQTPQPAES